MESLPHLALFLRLKWLLALISMESWAFKLWTKTFRQGTNNKHHRVFNPEWARSGSDSEGCRENAESDQHKRKAIDTKNQAESIIYQAEKQFLELESILSPESKTKVELVLAEHKETMKTNNTSKNDLKEWRLHLWNGSFELLWTGRNTQ